MLKESTNYAQSTHHHVNTSSLGRAGQHRFGGTFLLAPTPHRWRGVRANGQVRIKVAHQRTRAGLLKMRRCCGVGCPGVQVRSLNVGKPSELSKPEGCGHEIPL